MVGLIQDYSLVAFVLVDVKSERSLLKLKSAIDKVGTIYIRVNENYDIESFQANGYIYGNGEERSIQALLSCAVGARTETERFDADYM